MLSEQVEELLVERLVNRIEELNTYILKEIGGQLKVLGTVSPSKARKLAQTLKYGGDFDKIIAKLEEISGLNIQDIYDIFTQVAKSNQTFAKAFYKYRGIDFIPFKENVALQKQLSAIAKTTANTYANLSSTLGFVTKNSKGETMISNISQTYQNSIDRAVLGAIQGKESYNEAITQVMKELGKSGIKTVNYESGIARRLDSAVRMNIKDGIKSVTMEMQKQFGEEFEADGVEISVHTNSALDHEPVQGHQFSNEEFAKLQDNKDFKDYQGNKYSAIERNIGQLNCYHYIFSVILGVSSQTYTNEQLSKMASDNKSGFEFEGKKIYIV